MKDQDKTKEQLISELKELRQKLSLYNKEKADYDSLTGLPNRFLLFDRLTQALLQAKRTGNIVAVLFLVLNDFKLINDSFGHATGDRLLKAVAGRLDSCLRKSDTIARPGRNEFIVLLTEIFKYEYTIEIVEKIIHAFDLPLLIDNREIFMDIRIGISLYPIDGPDPDTLLKNSYTAMNNAREKSRHYMFFLKTMNSRALELFNMINDLRHAIKKEEFVLHYQPQINLCSERITGIEVLLRWQRPGAGLVSPLDFIEAAETSGLIIPIGDWVLETACSQQKAWQEAGIAPERIAVNISARQFHQPNMIEKIDEILQKKGLDPNSLELELTESVVFEDEGAAIATLVELKRLGVNVSIDDFGTGYSSLSMLKKFPADKLKIVSSFVRSISVNPVDAAIARLIIDFSKVLNINVIAEGVETVEQLEFLRAAGCNEIQGHLFSRAVDMTEATKLLTLRTIAVNNENK